VRFVSHFPLLPQDLTPQDNRGRPEIPRIGKQWRDMGANLSDFIKIKKISLRKISRLSSDPLQVYRIFHGWGYVNFKKQRA